MRFKGNNISGWGVLGIIALAVILLIFEPFVLFWLGYFSGWIAKLVVGETLAGALNVAFNTTYFSAAMLPKLAGSLAWIGSSFRNAARINNNNNN